ncbi:Lob domain-containing protein [Thalictrum thalictroides]|uniref:Lob domain-containing protein n=1 Tax=Thalictrum thalictroides TaxID=46969 RepID=A0A7J6V0H4_THATH|nr:Lob domain-containing protein [Thalictrum thalictroides]
MDDQQGHAHSSDRPPSNGRRGGKRIAPPTITTVVSSTAPCGACKFLRRKCVSGCIFAPYFGSDQGAARFAAVHKVFGASNVSKLLLHIPTNQRHDAVVTISYEAQTRLSDPVYGCVSTILALQQQVASLQTELSIVQTQLINSRLAVAILQPAYSNNSSASNNLVNLGSFPPNFDLVAETTPSSLSFRPTGVSGQSQDDEDSRNPNVYTNHILHSK